LKVNSQSKLIYSFQSSSSLTGIVTTAKSSPLSTGNLSVKTPVRSPTPKSNLHPPVWSKGCIRPHSPLRPRPQGANIGHSSAITSTSNLMGSPVPSSGSASGSNDPSMTPNESGSNRTLKRFMTMKKSKANEFLKRGENTNFFIETKKKHEFDFSFCVKLKQVKAIHYYFQSSKPIVSVMSPVVLRLQT